MARSLGIWTGILSVKDFVDIEGESIMYQRIGATYLGDRRAEFIVWAPLKERVDLQIVAPQERSIPMQRDNRGYWHITASDIEPETQYFYQLDGETLRPDPASQFQPNGVHQASQVVDHSHFTWKDSSWENPSLPDWIIYELHVGTFTPEGTFTAIIPRLKALKELGLNAIEIMPVAQFPGARNWGYDGVFPFAVQNSYGGPDGLKTLVNACHQQGIAVILDVVYNHFGPEGNYMSTFGPYFTEQYPTPWGAAINFDAPYSDGVRNLVVENVLYWLREYHIDGLRLDAIHAIFDFSAKHILAEVAEQVQIFSQQQERSYYLIAESDLGDVRVINPLSQNGYGLNAQWSDDFHHCLHALLTGEDNGYYQDFIQISKFAKVLKEGFAYSWDYSPFRKRYQGSYAGNCPSYQFVVCNQNHDQIGNRKFGDRLSHLVSFEALKLAAGATILSPYIPMLYMGEEYGEESPFFYFIDHSDPDLVAAVREGRKKEFQYFQDERETPDPYDIETFKSSILNWEKRKEGKHKVLLDFYKRLIQLRREIVALFPSEVRNIEIFYEEENLILGYIRKVAASQVLCLMNFNQQAINYSLVLGDDTWQKRLDSADSQWSGTGSSLPEILFQSQDLIFSSQSFVLYERKI